MYDINRSRCLYSSEQYRRILKYVHFYTFMQPLNIIRTIVPLFYNQYLMTMCLIPQILITIVTIITGVFGPQISYFREWAILDYRLLRVRNATQFIAVVVKYSMIQHLLSRFISEQLREDIRRHVRSLAAIKALSRAK